MKPTKNQIALLAIGAVAAVAAIVMGFLIFGAFSAKSGAVEALDSAMANARRLCKAQISPTQEAVDALDANRDRHAEWFGAACEMASEGDRAIEENLNEAAFKQQLIDDARELARLPGEANGAIVAPDFTFGFKDYIAGGMLPERDKIPLLQRQWGDIKEIVRLLSGCGAAEITSIEAKEEPKESEKPQTAAGKNAKKKAQAKTADDEPRATRCRYELQFKAKPKALAEAFNALVAAKRFTVVDAFSFSREDDMVARALSPDKGKSAAGPGRDRKRKRPRPGAESDDDAAVEISAAKKGVITDPKLEAPFVVRLSLSVYDFGSGKSADARDREPEEVAE